MLSFVQSSVKIEMQYAFGEVTSIPSANLSQDELFCNSN